MNFSEYHRELLSQFERTILPLERIGGLRVIRRPTSQRYAELLQGGQATVLYTHSRDNRLEFKDGMVPFESIVDRVDPDFHGIVDICTCKPIGLLQLLKRRAPRSTVKIMEELLSPVEWLAFYAYFFSQFIVGSATYWDAMAKTSFLFQKGIPPE